MDKDLKTILINGALPALIVGMLLYIISSSHSIEIELRERLTKLEQIVNQCEACKRNKKIYGGYEWYSSNEYQIGHDGRIKLGLEIDVLSEQYRWECDSYTDIKYGKKEAYLKQIIQSYAKAHHLRGVKGIVALGTASNEGGEHSQEKLSQDRSITLVNELRGNSAFSSIPIYGFSLGQYTEEKSNKRCSSHTSDQRRVILLKIIDADEYLLGNQQKLEDALREILVRKSIHQGVVFPIDVRKYSKFKKSSTMLIYGRNH